MLGFTALLNRLFPCLTHGFIQNLGIDQSHLWAGMRHPLLNENQAHSIVDEFNGFRMAKSMEAEMENVSLLIADVIFVGQMIETLLNSMSPKRIAAQEAATRAVVVRF